MSVTVAVGSTNPVKVAAATRVFTRAFPGAAIRSVDVPSGVKEQPVGEEETLRGAVRRAVAAREARDADFGAGIEAGVVLEGDQAWMMGYAAIAARSGRITWSRGLQVLLPPRVAGALRAGQELGPVMDGLTGIEQIKRKGGAISFLTDGLVDRTEMLAQMVAGALPPHLHAELYEGETAADPAAGPTRDFTVATFVVHRGKVLLLWHRRLQMWLPPGGHIDPHELPDEAAVREVEEETGVAVRLWSEPSMPPLPGPIPLARPEGIQLEPIEAGHEHIDLIYFAEPADPASVQPVANPEVDRAGWYGRKDLDRIPLAEEVRAWAEKALRTVGRRRRRRPPG